VGSPSEQQKLILLTIGNWPTQPRIKWVPGALTPGAQQPGHKADHSLPSSAEVKNMWSYTSIPLYVFITWYLIKQAIHLHGVVLSQAQEQLRFQERKFMSKPKLSYAVYLHCYHFMGTCIVDLT
jgi:hypothetical protein